MAISKEHHSLFLFQEAIKIIPLAGSKWAFLGNQRLRNAPRKCPNRNAWEDWWGFELPQKELPGDAHHKLHGIRNWMKWFDAAEYLTIDCNGKDGCLKHDLNLPVPSEYHGRYDVVANFGTSEHVKPDQQPCFQTIHDLCRPGGLMLHAVPSVGCNRHGSWRYPLMWFGDLANAQDYHGLIAELYPVSHNRGTGPHLYAVLMLRKMKDQPWRPDFWNDPPPCER